MLVVYVNKICVILVREYDYSTVVHWIHYEKSHV